MKSHVFLASLGIAGSAVLVGQLTANTASPLMAPAGGDMNLGGGEDVWDVTPCRIGSLTQFGNIGNYPDGTVGMGLSTTGQNVGNVQLPWYDSPDVHHPVIGQNMYRITEDGRLEQIGLSWLKHAWFAVQGTSCGSCNSSGSGARLGVGCADTYGASLNADQFWLGPRWEVKPNAQIWMDGQSWIGSHFERNSQGGDSSSHNPVQHRLRVRMGDLTTPGASYYYEGLYWLNKLVDDPRWGSLDELQENMFNNARHQRVIPNRSGNSFSFSDTGGEVEGPIVWQWGDVQSEAAPNDDGVVYVASRSVDLGNGQYRYEYAVFNFSLDREVGELAIPVSGNVTDIGFHAPKDGYWDSNGNFVNESPYDDSEWNSSVASGEISFTPADPGNLDPNTIRYGTLYTYWFTTDMPPAEENRTARIIPQQDGEIAELTAEVTAPQSQAVQAILTDLAVTTGDILSGGLADIQESDDVRLVTESGFGDTFIDLHSMEMIIGADTDVASPSKLDVSVEASIDQPSGTTQVRLFNWNTGQMDLIGSFPVGETESVGTVNTPAANDYVDGDGTIQTSVKHIVFVPFLAFTFQSSIDEVRIDVTP